MTPERTTNLSLQFAAAASPWWLLLLAPLIGGLAWWLYRNQWRDLSRPMAAGLTSLRVALLVGLAVLLFRPNLIFREVLTYQGRVLVVLDDSASMTTRDAALSDVEALRLARRLAMTQAPLDRLATQLGDVEAQLRGFEAFAREHARDDDAFWVRADTVQTALTTLLDTLAQDLPSAAAAAADKAEVASATRALADLKAGLAPFFGGESDPGARAYTAYYTQLDATEAQLLDLQAALDRAALAAGDTTLRTQIDAVRGKTRLELLEAMRTQALPGFQAALPDQYVQTLSLSSGAALDGALAAQDGSTDIVGRLSALAAEPSDFPLSAVVLVSDGRDLAGGDLAALTRELARQQVPAFSAAVGSVREPTDLAVLDVTAPPFAVVGRVVTVRVRLKTALPARATTRVTVKVGGVEAASEEIEVGAAAEQEVVLKVTPKTVGLQRFTLEVKPVDGEVFPVQNNRAEFAMRVREEGVKVLFLDGTPRWETRFALNILQRLDYLDLNAMVALTQPDGVVQRGVTKGTWPKDAATLAMYDLIVIGKLPAGLLTDPEWAMLADAVTTGGKTLFFLTDGTATPLPAAFTDALLPLTADAFRATPEDLEALGALPAGGYHPLTRAMAPGLRAIAMPNGDGDTPDAPDAPSAPASTAAPIPGMLDTTVPLLATQVSGRPLLATRFVGAGRTALLNTDMLWKRLNTRALQAHSDLYVQLVSWAVDGDGLSLNNASPDGAPKGGAGSQLALDGHVLAAGEALQVWLNPAVPEGTEVSLLRAGETIATAQAAYAYDSSGLRRAVFPSVPAGDLTLRLAGDADPAHERPLLVLDNPVELRRLAQDAAFLQRLAAESGGTVRNFAELERFAPAIKPKTRIEKHERVWRLWESGWIFALIFGALTLEWVWRKFVGLV